MVLFLSQSTLGSFKHPQQSRRESYHLQSGPRMQVIFQAQPSELQKLPFKPLCCTVHLEPYESTFSPGKVKHKDIGKEHISAGSSSVHGQSFSTPFQAPWTSSQAEACCTCMFFKQKGTMHGRISPVKEDQAMHWLLKHGNKSFPASPVPWSLNGMACPVVLSAIWGGTLEE